MDEKQTQTLVKGMLQSERPRALRSRAGLVLSFTPQRPGGPAFCQLALARQDRPPSHVETGVVLLAVRRALHAQKRALADRPQLREDVPLRKGWHSHVITWRWAATAVPVQE